MKHYSEISAQDPSDQKDTFPCPECRRETNHSILSIVNSHRFENDGYTQYLENFLIVQCDGCGTISFSRISRCTEHEDYTNEGKPYLPKVKTHFPGFNQVPLEEEDFINNDRVNAVSALPKDKYDTKKLEQLLFELNQAYKAHSYFSCLMLIRSIVDHVPPIFQKSSFTEIANNYAGGGKSFRESMIRLDSTCRKLADGLLHLQIRKNESIPTRHQVEFRADIDALLGEIIRVFPKQP